MEHHPQPFYVYWSYTFVSTDFAAFGGLEKGDTKLFDWSRRTEQKREKGGHGRTAWKLEPEGGKLKVSNSKPWRNFIFCWLLLHYTYKLPKLHFRLYAFRTPFVVVVVGVGNYGSINCVLRLNGGNMRSVFLSFDFQLFIPCRESKSFHKLRACIWYGCCVFVSIVVDCRYHVCVSVCDYVIMTRS